MKQFTYRKASGNEDELNCSPNIVEYDVNLVISCNPRRSVLFHVSRLLLLLLFAKLSEQHRFSGYLLRHFDKLVYSAIKMLNRHNSWKLYTSVVLEQLHYLFEILLRFYGRFYSRVHSKHFRVKDIFFFLFLNLPHLQVYLFFFPLLKISRNC